MRWAVRRARRPAIVAGASVLILVAAAALVGALRHRDGASGCPDLLLVGARGSGERVDEAVPSGFGREAATLARAVTEAAGGRGWSTDAVGVDYPAIPEPEARADHAAFEASVAAGAEDAVAILRARATCAATRIVLIGSSQGAVVMHRAARELATDDRPPGALLGVVLLGDPTRSRREAAVEFRDLDGVAEHDGFLAGRGSGADDVLASGLGAGRVLEVCSAADTVCSAPDPGWSSLTVSEAHHTAYTRPEVLAAVVAWLAERPDPIAGR